MASSGSPILLDKGFQALIGIEKSPAAPIVASAN